jgi:hypothetical protein
VCLGVANLQLCNAAVNLFTPLIWLGRVQMRWMGRGRREKEPGKERSEGRQYIQREWGRGKGRRGREDKHRGVSEGE